MYTKKVTGNLVAVILKERIFFYLKKFIFARDGA